MCTRSGRSYKKNFGSAAMSVDESNGETGKMMRVLNKDRQKREQEFAADRRRRQEEAAA